MQTDIKVFKYLQAIVQAKVKQGCTLTMYYYL